MLRRAEVLSKVDPYIVGRYMPDNYKVYHCGEVIMIAGKDVAGWTLDGYVIPRLQSGNIIAKEVD